jgi:hypothetical protein
MVTLRAACRLSLRRQGAGLRPARENQDLNSKLDFEIEKDAGWRFLSIRQAVRDAEGCAAPRVLGDHQKTQAGPLTARGHAGVESVSAPCRDEACRDEAV